MVQYHLWFTKDIPYLAVTDHISILFLLFWFLFLLLLLLLFVIIIIIIHYYHYYHYPVPIVDCVKFRHGCTNKNVYALWTHNILMSLSLTIRCNFDVIITSYIQLVTIEILKGLCWLIQWIMYQIWNGYILLKLTLREHWKLYIVSIMFAKSNTIKRHKSFIFSPVLISYIIKLVVRLQLCHWVVYQQ